MTPEIGTFYVIIFSLAFLLVTLLVFTIILRKRILFQQKEIVEFERKKQAQDLFQKIFSASPVGIALINLQDNTFADMNDNFLILTGYDINELTGQDFYTFQIFSDLVELEKYKSISKNEAHVKDVRTRIQTKSGDIKWGQVSLQSIMVADSEYLLLVVDDITREIELARLDELEMILLSDMATAKITQETNKGFCKVMLKKLTEAFKLKTGVIRLYNPKNDMLEFLSGVNVDETVFTNFAVKQGEGDVQFLSAHVAATRKPIIAENVTLRKDLADYMQNFNYFNVKSLLTYPLISATEKLLGIIHLWSDEIVPNIKRDKLLFERVLTLFVSGIERNIAQEELIKNEEQYRHLYDAATVGLFRTEIASGKLIAINQYGANLLNFDNVDDALASEMITIDHYEEEGKKSILRTLARNGVVHDYEMIWVHDNGHKSYFLTSMKAYKDKGFVEGSFLDITDRKLVESALTYSEERFRNVVNSSPLGVNIFEIDEGKLVLSGINPSAKKILETTGGVGIGCEIAEVFPYNMFPYMQEIFTKIAVEGAGSWDKAIVIPSGKNLSSEKHIEFHAFQTAPENMVAMFSDVTGKRKAEIERVRMSQILKEKNKELEQLLYVTSHDLRSPLVNILGFSGELEDDLLELASLMVETDDVEEIRSRAEIIVGERLFESSQFIQKSAKKIDILLKSLLKLSRIGRKSLTFEIINMNEMFEDIIDTMQFQIGKANVKIEISDLPSCVGDKDQLNQVFSNLLDNAIKYRKPEDGTSIKISGNSKENVVSYCVEDDGIGIKREHQGKIFMIFHRLNPGVGSGFGLGMTIVQRIVSKHGGKVWLDSSEGIGTKVYVELPLETKTIGEGAKNE